MLLLPDQPLRRWRSGSLCQRQRRQARVIPALVILVLGQQRPGYAGILVGQGNSGDIGVHTSEQFVQPAWLLWGLFFSLCSKDSRARTVNEQGAQVTVPAFGNAQQRSAPAAGMLTWHQTEPGRQLAGLLEVRDISYGAQQCAGRQGPDTGNLGQTLAQLTAAVPQHDVALEQLDLLIEVQHLIQQALDQLAKGAGQQRVFEQSRHTLAQSAQAHGHDQAELGEFATNLVAVG